MKKLLAIILTLVIVLSFAGCGGGKDVTGEIKNDNSSSNDADTSPEIDLSLGKAEGNVYENKFIGIGCKLAEGWAFYTDEQIRALNNITGDMLDEDLVEQLKDANLIYDMYASDEAGNSMNVNLEKIGVVNAALYSAKDYVDSSLSGVKEALEQIGFSNTTANAVKVNFAGKEYDAIEVVASNGQATLYETVVCIKVSNYIAAITVASLDKTVVDATLKTFYEVK